MSFAGIAIGAGVGLAGSLIMPAIQGKPITLKGALIGAGTGALTGGVASALAPAASAATSSASNAATTGLGQIGGQAVKTGATEAAKTAATEAAKTAGTEAVKTGAAEAVKTGAAEAAKTGTGELASQAGGQGFDKVMGATTNNLSAPNMPAGFGEAASGTAPTGGVANLPTNVSNMGLSSTGTPNAYTGMGTSDIVGSNVGGNSLNATLAAPAKSSFGAVSPDFSGLSGEVPKPAEGMFGSSISTGSKGADTALEKLGVEGLLGGGKEGLGAYQDAQAQKAQNKNYNQSAAEMAADAAVGQTMANDLYSNQIKGPMLAKGGSIHMDSGSFVIPADIVSALGDGSSEGGFRFLESFFRDMEA